MERKSNVLRLAYGGMLAALIFVATYFFQIPVSLTQGYIHLGDGFILLGAALLGSAAIPAAALGSMLSDLLGGYTLYILPTFLIKGAVAAVTVRCYAKQRPLPQRALLLTLAELVMVGGYFVMEWLVLGYGWAAALGAVIPNLVQGLSGVVIALILTPLVGRVKALRP